MAQTSTVYDIRLQYMLEDSASRKAKVLGRNLAKVTTTADMFERSNRDLAMSLRRVGTAVGAFVGVRAASKALIGYNASMEQARTTTAGLIMTTTGARWHDSLQAASDIVGELEQRAKTSTATTAEMVEFSREVTQPLLAAGLGWKQIAEFSADAVVAAKAFGDEGIAAMDIQQALNQGVTIRDRFSRKLLGTIKLTREEFNKMNQQQRLATLQRAISGPGIKRLAQEQAGTFAGAFSTLKDQLQIFLGQVGLPLFQRITAEIRTWNDWLEKNKDSVNSMADRLSTGLTTAFNVIREVAAFFAKHADMMLKVATIWAGLKLGRVVGGLASATGQLLGRGVKRLGAGALATGFDAKGLGMAKLGASVMTATNAFAKFIPAIGAAGAAFFALRDFLRKDLSERQQRTRKEGLEAVRAVRELGVRRAEATRTVGRFAGAAGIRRADRVRAFGQAAAGDLGPARLADPVVGFQGAPRSVATQLELRRAQQIIRDTEETLLTNQRSLLRWAVENELINKSTGKFRFDWVKIQNQIRDGLRLTNTQWRQMNRELTILQTAVQTGAINLSELFRETPGGGFAIPTVTSTAAATAPDVKVTIQRIEVRSDDPDRFVFNMQSAVSKLATNPSQAGDIRRLGGQ